ncbi:MAG: TetR/AcrR family transcriptional regulator [Clostridiales bacterium]|nr:TetR/AcrR family transcriptional regulator [Clostridiales bacterium]
MRKQPEITEKTRQKFVDAFWELAAEKPIAKIAVSELTKRAGYNRSTFYEYFVDTDHLLTYIEDKLLDKVKATIVQMYSENASLENLFPIIFTAMNDRIYILMGPNGDSGFHTKIKEEIIPFITNYFPIPADAPNFDYLTSFVNSAMFGLLQYWNEKGKDISSKKICDMIQSLVLHGLLNYTNPEA